MSLLQLFLFSLLVNAIFTAYSIKKKLSPTSKVVPLTSLDSGAIMYEIIAQNKEGDKFMYIIKSSNGYILCSYPEEITKRYFFVKNKNGEIVII